MAQKAKTAAEALQGLTLNGVWRVSHQLIPPIGKTPGFFSVGYIVENIQSGNQGFLKALNLELVLGSPKPLEMLQELVNAFNHEKRLLHHCRTMKNVITPLDEGSVVVPGFSPPLDNVHFVITELADCDVRIRLGSFDQFELALRLRCLHHVAQGLHQLHHDDIAHQDLKAANILMFEQQEAKLGDLGRGSMVGAPAQHDALPFAGDRRFAPPELLYHQLDTDWRKRRFGGDIYHLGSLTMFFFSFVNTTHAILSKLPMAFRPQKWKGTYADILPHVRNAWNQVMVDFDSDVTLKAGRLAPDIRDAAAQLTEPDPTRRGHPKTFSGIGSQHSLERYISLFDRLATYASRGRY